MKFLNNLTLEYNELQKAKIHPLGADPGSLGAGHEGYAFYHTGVDRLKLWDGSQFNSIPKSGDIVNADINGSAAIAYSKLNLATSIVNADIAGAAAIAYSKLNLTGGIVNADISASAAIAHSKIALTGTSVADVHSTGSGTAGAPGFAFTGDLDTGFYRPSGGIIVVAGDGADIATFDSGGITLSVGVYDGDIETSNGSAGTPSHRFVNDTNTGMYRAGADSLGFSTGGTLRFNLQNTLASLSVALYGYDGTASAPTYSFSSTGDMGIYRVSSGVIGFSTGGTLRKSISTTAITTTLQQLSADGTAGAPTYSFTSDPDTGVYWSTANQINFSAGGTMRMSLNSSALSLTGSVALDVGSGGITSDGNVDLSSIAKVINMVDPTSAQDAATKAYVDSMASGLDPKGSVRVATTAAGTLASSFENGDTIDGVVLATGNRILIKDQAAGAENGIYVVAASGAPARATDADVSAEVTSGMYVWVEEGTANGDQGYILTTNNPITLGSTALVFTQFSGAGQITAGAGLTKTGNTIDVGAGLGITVNADDIALASSTAGAGLTYTSGVLDVVGTSNRISVAANSIDISSSYVGQATITTLGTIGTGTWQGTAVGVAYGGTGQATAKAARETGLVSVGYYSSATHSSGTTITVTQSNHTCRASKGLKVQVQDEATGDVEYPDINVAASGDVVITYSTSQSANSKRITIVG